MAAGAASLGRLLAEDEFKCLRSYRQGSFFQQRTAPHIR
jgi:hypothetical protein